MRSAKPRTFFIENLGCPKNLVQGEGMAETLVRAGYAATADPDRADVVVVNTCSFIRPAQEESVERFGDALKTDVPELDGILGTRRWHEIDRLLAEVERGEKPCWHEVPNSPARALDPTFTRTVSAPTAYVKIAEGCNMTCTFCAI